MTAGCSVKRSSRPKKSPCSKQIGLHDPKLMSPRLWYFVTSFSHDGLFALRSSASRDGTWGMFDALTHGNFFLTYLAGLNFLPAHVRYGLCEGSTKLPPAGRSITSAVWLTTMSMYTFSPRRWAQATKLAKSWFVPRCASTLVKSTPQ